MKLLFFGTPEFAIPSLDALCKSGHEIRMVISRPDKEVGRKKILTPPPLVQAARNHGLEVFQPSGLKAQETLDVLRSQEADAGVVVAYGRMIPLQLLNTPTHGMINLHPSLLPRHRGPSPIQWALVSGDRRTGVTTMLLDEGMDTGPIFLQKASRIDDWENAESLSRRLAIEGADLLVRTLDEIESDGITPRPQADEGVTITPMIRRDFGKMDWSLPDWKLHNRFRGFTPWPGCFTMFRGDRMKIHGMERFAPAPEGQEPPGTILKVSSEGIVVRCGGSSALILTEVQREGRRRMPADAFLIGERVCPGEYLD